MRKNILYASRLRGDLDLGLDHVRVDGQGAKRWAQIVSPGGLVPGGSEQGVLEESATANYRVGSRLVIDDRKYQYALSDADRILRTGYGAYPMIDYGETAAAAATAALGTYVVSCTAQAAVDADEYAEGTLQIDYAAGAKTTRHKIKSNTVQATPGQIFTVTVYDALVANITTETITLWHSPWREIHCMRQEVLDGVMTRWQYVSFVGVPNRQITAARYFWLQVAGPCLCMLSGGNEGAIINDRDMHFDTNGAVMHQSYLAADHYQRCGYILPHCEAGNMPGGTGLIMLQLGQ